MRCWLLAVCLCWFMAQTENKDHFGLFDGCVKKNLYMHESVCPGPYRYYFAFHRVLFDCIRVRTKCPRFHKYNEYDTLKECQKDCADLMVVPEASNSTDKGNETSTDDDGKTGGTGGKGGKGGKGTQTKSGLDDVGSGEKKEGEKEKEKEKEKEGETPAPPAFRRANPYVLVDRRVVALNHKKPSARVLGNLTQKRKRRSKRYH